METYLNVPGSALDALLRSPKFRSNSPDSRKTLPTLVSPMNVADNYGVRMTTYYVVCRNEKKKTRIKLGLKLLLQCLVYHLRTLKNYWRKTLPFPPHASMHPLVAVIGLYFLTFLRQLVPHRSYCHFNQYNYFIFSQAPETGQYTFYVAGDDQCRLSISSDRDPKNLRQIVQFRNGLWTRPNQLDK